MVNIALTSPWYPDGSSVGAHSGPEVLSGSEAVVPGSTQNQRPKLLRFVSGRQRWVHRYHFFLKIAFLIYNFCEFNVEKRLDFPSGF